MLSNQNSGIPNGDDESSIKDSMSIGKATPWFTFGSALVHADENNLNCIVEEGRSWTDQERARDIQRAHEFVQSQSAFAGIYIWAPIPDPLGSVKL